MSSQDKFTVIDGVQHVIGQGEHTVCYLPIPFGNEYSTGDATSDICPECADKAGIEVPKAKAKSGAKA